MMPELQLVGLALQRQSNQLVPQADAEDRHPSRHIPDRLLRVHHRIRIARTIGEKHSVRLQRQHVFRRGLGRNHRHIAARTHQPPQNVVLDSIVEGNHLLTLWRRIRSAADSVVITESCLIDACGTVRIRSSTSPLVHV